MVYRSGMLAMSIFMLKSILQLMMVSNGAITKTFVTKILIVFFTVNLHFSGSDSQGHGVFFVTTFVTLSTLYCSKKGILRV